MKMGTTASIKFSFFLNYTIKSNAFHSDRDCFVPRNDANNS